MQSENHPSIDWKAVAAVVLTTLILSVDHYRDLIPDFTWNSIFLYFVLPALAIVLFFRQPLADYGFRVGNWKLGLAASAVSMAAITALLPFVVRFEDFNQYYSTSTGPVLPFIAETAAGMLGWEFFFRGFLLFALARVAGPYAILLQAVPFTLAHFGKPELETLSCIFGGSAFGWLAWRTKSFLYPFLIHTYLSVMIVLMAQ